MNEENKSLMIGIVCYWVGAVLVMCLDARHNMTHIAVIAGAGLFVPMGLTYFRDKL